MRTSRHISMVGTTAPSHIYPSLALIRELVNRGHRVTYTVGEQLVDLVTPTGAEVIAHPSILPLNDTEWPDDPGAAMRVFLDEGIVVMPILTARYDDDPPDLFLYDIGGLPAPLLAARYGVPAVQLSPTYVAWDGYEDDMADFLTALTASASGIAYYATYNAWLRENNIETDATAWQSRPAHGLVLIPRAMQPNAEKVADNIRFVGPCLDPVRLADTSWQPPMSGNRVLLVSFGTAFNDQLPVYRDCVEAFGNSDWHVVMAIGQHVDPADLGELPDNIEVHRTVPQLAVLAHADAFITHAGMGGCTEALWFGVPTVAIPQAVDQFGNAAMLESLGVGAPARRRGDGGGARTRGERRRHLPRGRDSAGFDQRRSASERRSRESCGCRGAILAVTRCRRGSAGGLWEAENSPIGGSDGESDTRGSRRRLGVGGQSPRVHG